MNKRSPRRPHRQAMARGGLGLLSPERPECTLLALEPGIRLGDGLPVHGYNECLIMYILAAASPTHGVPAAVYHEGWAQDGAIVEPHKVEGIELHLRYQGTEAGPLFWAQYSFLGLDPTGLKDEYCTDYFHEMRNLTLVNRAYCIRNPKHYKGFGPDCWG